MPSKVYSVNVVDVSSILDSNEMEVFVDLVTNSFSWGDTDMALVSVSSLTRVLARHIHSQVAQKLRAYMATLNEETMINLSS